MAKDFAIILTVNHGTEGAEFTLGLPPFNISCQLDPHDIN